MVQAKDLRSGNLVTGSVIKEGRFVDYQLTETKTIVVDSILDLGEYGGKINNQHDSWEYDLKNCHPIPITEEWLLKFGYNKNPNGGYNHPDILFVLYGCEGEYSFCTNEGYDINIRLKHLHKFQNLHFELSGQELKIDN